MAEYKYVRKIVNGDYDINNPYDVDMNGNSVTLFTRIMNALPDDNLSAVILDGEVATVVIDELNDNDLIILNDTVAAHIAAAGEINYETSIKLISRNGTNYEIYVDNDGNILSRRID